MADIDKIKINGVPYNVKDTATSQAVQQQGEQIAQQGQQITQQGQQITQQGQQIAELQKHLHLYPPVNALEIGFTNDGVTDNASALQQAIEDGYTAISFPEGTYLFTSFDISKTSMYFVGCKPVSNYERPLTGDVTRFMLQNPIDWDASADVWAATNSHAFVNILFTPQVDKANPVFSIVKNGLFYGCCFYNFSSFTTGSTHIASFSQCMWRDMETALNDFYDIVVSSSYIAYNQKNIYITKGGGGSAFSACKIEGATEDNIHIINSTNILFTGCFLDVGHDSIHLEGCQNVNIVGCSVQNYRYHALTMLNCSNCRIDIDVYFAGEDEPYENSVTLDNVRLSKLDIMFNIPSKFTSAQYFYTVRLLSPCPGTVINSTGGNVVNYKFTDTFTFYPAGVNPHNNACAMVVISSTTGYYVGIVHGPANPTGATTNFTIEKISGSLVCTISSQANDGAVTLSCAGENTIWHS